MRKCFEQDLQGLGPSRPLYDSDVHSVALWSLLF